MAFLGSILPSIGKFGSNVIKDIVSGGNLGQSLKNRGLETIRNLPIIGELAAPLVEKLGDTAFKKITRGAKTKKGKKRQKAIRKIFGGRLTPAGANMARVAAKTLTGKDVLEQIQQGDKISDVLKESIKEARKKGGKVTGEDISDIYKIVESMKRKK